MHAVNWVANQVVRFGLLGQKSAIILNIVATARLNKKLNSGVPRQLLQELKHNLVMRHVSSGIELLDRHEHLLQRLARSCRTQLLLLAVLLEWVDIGYRRACFD